MNSEKVISLKRRIGKLSIEEVGELKKYIQQTFDKKSKQRHQERRVEEYNRKRSLDIGTLVVVEDARSHLAGKTGIIERHLGGRSRRTAVRMEETNLSWLIPTACLSDDLSENNLNRIKQNMGFAKLWNGIMIQG